MPRKKVDPHALGYRFYRGYIYQRRPEGYCRLWDPQGRFICIISLRDIPRYVNKSIKFGWERLAPVPRATRFEQLEMFKVAA